MTKDQIIEFCLKHKELFLHHVTANHPFRMEFLEEYAKNWEDFSAISSNENIQWTSEFIYKYRYQLNWLYLTGNKGIHWTDEMINQYEVKWDDWCYLSESPTLPWKDESFLKKYQHKILWGRTINQSKEWFNEFFDTIAPYYDWDAEEIGGYISRLTSFPWTKEVIEKYAKHWHWAYLSHNTTIPWSLQFVQKFDEWLDWEEVAYNPAAKKALEEHIDEDFMKAKNLPWAVNLLKKYRTKTDWQSLSFNPNLPWSQALIEQYQTKIDFSELSRNHSKFWSFSLIEHFEDRWDWDRLSYNEALPWSTELLKKYEDRWNWKSISRNTGVPWSIELLEACKDKIDWEYIDYNEAVPWSIELIQHFDELLNSNFYSTNNFYENVLAPHLNNDLIEQIIVQIQKDEQKYKYYTIEGDLMDWYGLTPSLTYESWEAGNEMANTFSDEKFWSNPKIFNLYLEESYEGTPRFLDVHRIHFGATFTLVVSERLKAILERFNMPAHRFYEINVGYDEQYRQTYTDTQTYYILHLLDQEREQLDYKRTSFQVADFRDYGGQRKKTNSSQARKVYPPGSIPDFETFKQIDHPLYDKDLKLKPIQKHYPHNYDIFWAGINIVISEDVKEVLDRLEISKNGGFKLNRFTN